MNVGETHMSDMTRVFDTCAPDILLLRPAAHEESRGSTLEEDGTANEEVVEISPLVEVIAGLIE